ncbi:MAG TPA: hypothetical protein VMT18_11655 [Planctomycetota bacterium]|nr:hypothetical protein [Planctomycetota bacterium]
MRMWKYFVLGASLLALALLATVLAGLAHDGSARHLWIGLFTVVLGVGVHTLVILFMLVTGRVLREAMRARSLAPEFLARLNDFFSRRSAYPLAVLGASTLVAAGVLGMSARGFAISPAWHMLLGLAAAGVNLWALQKEYRVLRLNQVLIDEVAAELDALDRASPPPPVDPAEGGDPGAVPRFGLSLAVGAWLPYLYWALITWRGDFSRVSVHPWLEASLAGLALWWWSRRAL